MPPNTLQPTPEELEELRFRRRASQLKGYGEGADDPTAQALLNVRRNLGEIPRAIVGAKPYEETNPTGSYRAVQALMNAPTPAAIIPEAAQAAGKAATALSGLGALSGVIKPKGGNWLAGTVERALKPMKNEPIISGELIDAASGRELFKEYQQSYKKDPTMGLVEWTRKNHPEVYDDLLRPEEAAINNWIDTKLGKYIRNELGTPEDPVRALAEREILHFTPQGGAVSAHTHRKMLGMPTEPTATSPLAQSWEDVADATITGGPYREHLPLFSTQPNEILDVPETLRQLGGEYAVQNPDALAYELNRGTPLSEGLGFRHLIDELTNATDPDSGLPRSLQLSPEKLQKVTVPQAVELVDKINKWRAEQKVAADLKRSQNAATVEYKAYDTVPGTTEPNQRGLRWVELRAPTESLALPKGYSIQTSHGIPYLQDEKGQVVQYLDDANGVDAAAKKVVGRMSLEDALKYEGEVMGHCVGGYCPAVAEGRTRIYSLRDAKGEPHVTIEVQPNPYAPRWEVVKGYLPQAEEMMRARGITNAREEEISELATQLAKENMPPLIQQIKGKANRAPKDEYLPFVQDFVRSGRWSSVGDLQNTGMRSARDVFSEGELNMLRQAGQDVPPALSGEDIQRLHNLITPEGRRLKYNARGQVIGSEDPNYAAGGAVRMKDGGKPPKRRASDLPGYGEGSAADMLPAPLLEAARAIVGVGPSEPTNPSEVYRIAQTLANMSGAAPVLGGVVKGSGKLKSLGEMIDREVRKVRRMEELGKPGASAGAIPAPRNADVPGWHITSDFPGILKTGAMTNRDVGVNNIQGHPPAHVGGAYFYSDPRLALNKRDELLEMVGYDPDYAAEIPILRAQLRQGNRLVSDEDVGLNIPWQKSFEEGSFATTRPVLLNQIDRIYAENPDLIKDIIRDTAVRQRRYKKGGAVTDPNEPEVKRLPEPGLLTATMYAETAAREMYPKDPVKRDAARHMIASSILGQKLSPGTSRLLGELYEFKTSPLLHLKSAVGLGAPPPGYEMDKFNNALGSEMQFRNQAELQRGVRQAVDTGRARLTPDEPAPYRRGGAVKIETNPTLMADELLFKGHKRR